jgi:predicted MFS family arabinose efflux permease
MLVTFAVGTETYVFSGLLTRLAKDLNISIATAGQLSSSFAIAYALPRRSWLILQHGLSAKMF